ncbi:MAG: hypothetical protein JO271_08580 [Verrucomicrobia bacterium]|nr:hypothetical protein [Verrucomicrobiota bacterium]
MSNRVASESGTILVIVLAVVFIAALIATSYLIFVDNQRARAGRNVDQDTQRISIEQALLALKSSIRSELLMDGSLDLSSLDRSDKLSGFSLKLTSHIDLPGPLSVQPFTNTADSSQLSSLQPQDLFGGARARVTMVDINLVAQPNQPISRLPDLNLTGRPQIAVREIPVSEFTVFSAGDSFSVGGTVSNGDIGRVFSLSSLSLSSNVSSQFPVLASQEVNLTGDASLRVMDPSQDNAPVTFSAAQNSDFLAEARTELNSRVITGNVLPVDSAPLNSVYGTTGSPQGAGSGLNLNLLKTQCDLLVVARPDVVITMPNGTKGCLVNAVGKSGDVSGLTYPAGGTASAAFQTQVSSGSQTAPFAAAPNRQNPSQIILAFDYARLAFTRFGSVFLVVEAPTGLPVSNAIVLIRGAQTLSRPISIVSPHPIILAGDFNSGDGTADTPAASIITPATVGTAPLNWGSDVFGDI